MVSGGRQGWRDEVARAAAADAGGVDPGLLGDFLDRLAAAGPGHEVDRHAGAAFAALGAHAAEQGVSLRAVVDLYLSAAWRAWAWLPQVAGGEPGAVREAGQRALRICDDVVAALADGYTSARRGLLRREDSARREFVDDLLAGTADPAGLLSRAESYGLHLAGAHAVVVARASNRWHEASPVLAEVGAALQKPLGGTVETLITTRNGDLVVILPTVPGDARDSAVAAARDALGRRESDSAGLRLAVGRPHPGPSGVARSFTEARDALQLAQTLALPERVVHAERLLVYQVLVRDRAALLDLLDSTLLPLREARGGAEPLLATLQAYFDTGGNTTRTAAVLHLSVRAVTYRLTRIATLTGLHPNDPDQRYVLHTAVLGARALGWPDNTGETAGPRQ